MSVLQLQFNGDSRRLLTVPPTFSSLKVEVNNLFGIRNPGLVYVDEEGDEITVDNQQEYQEFLRLNRTTPIWLQVLSSNRQYKLGPESFVEEFSVEPIMFASRLSVSEYVDEPTIYPEPCSDLKAVSPQKPNELRDIVDHHASYLETRNVVREILQSELEKQSPTQSRKVFAEFNTPCSVCLESPIKEVMFRCITCTAFSLCKSCEEICKHPHPFFKLRKLSHLKSLNTVSPRQSPELEDKRELLVKELESMGFSDRAQVYNALTKANFDLGQAVGYLIS